MKIRYSDLTSALGFFLFFSFIFIQFPLQGSLPGKVDSWFYLTAFKCINNYILHFFTGGHLGTALYPEINVFTFGNYSFGQAIFFIPFKWAGLNDIWAYYFFITILFSLNAYAVYLISRHFSITGFFSFLCGLMFAANNYAYATADNVDALFLSVGLLGFFYLQKYFEHFRPAHLYLAVILLGLEVYFSSYGFLFTAIAFILYSLFFIPNIFNHWKSLLIATILAILVIYPYLHLYILNAPISSGYNPASNLYGASKASLKLIDFFRPLKYNIYYNLTTHGDFTWLYKTRSVFIGIALPLLGLAGVFILSGKRRNFLLSVIIIFFIIACGAYLPFENTEIPGPLYRLYEQFHINHLLRISVRAYFFVVLAIALGAAKMLQTIAQSRAVLAAGFFLLIFIENTPSKFETYHSQQWIDISDRIPRFDSNAIVLNLPSSIFSHFYPKFKPECNNRTDYEFEFMREYFYMYQQTLHKANTINAFVGFIPASRMNNQFLIDGITEGSKECLEKIIERNRLTHIVFHKRLLNGCSYSLVLSLLNSCPILKKDTETDDFIVYKVYNSNSIVS